MISLPENAVENGMARRQTFTQEMSKLHGHTIGYVLNQAGGWNFTAQFGRYVAARVIHIFGELETCKIYEGRIMKAQNLVPIQINVHDQRSQTCTSSRISQNVKKDYHFSLFAQP